VVLGRVSLQVVLGQRREPLVAEEAQQLGEGLAQGIDEPRPVHAGVDGDPLGRGKVGRAGEAGLEPLLGERRGRGDGLAEEGLGLGEGPLHRG
jgi:hypothetical protein